MIQGASCAQTAHTLGKIGGKPRVKALQPARKAACNRDKVSERVNKIADERLLRLHTRRECACIIGISLKLKLSEGS